MQKWLCRIIPYVPLLVLGPALLMVLWIGGVQAETPDDLSRVVPSTGLEVADIPFYSMVLRRPGVHTGSGYGNVTVAFPETPFGVAVTPGGTYIYDLVISGERLPRRRNGVFVAWVAPNSLDEIRKIGEIARGDSLRTRVDFDNKFVVFISEEAHSEIDEPQGRVIGRAISRSSRMDGLFSHGFCPPDAPC